MTTALVVLAAVVIGGGYVFWRVSQNQYYVGTNSNGEVVIYRGISQRIVGLSWSSPYQQTGILLSQVPSNYQQTVKTDTQGSTTVYIIESPKMRHWSSKRPWPSVMLRVSGGICMPCSAR